ncbi:MAG TPA: carbohydrate ABC transporter permease, partial [Xanthobacteraceae bacterium]|nr:carbohydrate ABC transporter permease [Xanthobacteraceae bacterium]
MTNVLWVRASYLSRLLVYILLSLAAVFTIVPFLWAMVNSIKTVTDTFQPGALVPYLNFSPTLQSWHEVLSDPQVVRAFVSSVVVSCGTTVFVLVLGVPAAYSLARFTFPIPSNDIALWFLSQRVLPPAVVLVPFYLLMVQLRLIDTWTGLIFCYSTFNLAFAVVIMRDIFRDVSSEVEDAAKVEGATAWQIFWLVALPLSLDGLVVTSVLVFAFTWNEALFASALTSQDAMTFSALVLASRSTRGVDFNIASVNTLIGIIPPVILYFFVQRYLARGLTFGAVKG